MNSKSREIAPNFGNRVSQPGQERFWCCAQADSPLVSQLTFATDFRNMQDPMLTCPPEMLKNRLWNAAGSLPRSVTGLIAMRSAIVRARNTRNCHITFRPAGIQFQHGYPCVDLASKRGRPKAAIPVGTGPQRSAEKGQRVMVSPREDCEF